MDGPTHAHWHLYQAGLKFKAPHLQMEIRCKGCKKYFKFKPVLKVKSVFRLKPAFEVNPAFKVNSEENDHYFSGEICTACQDMNLTNTDM